MIKAIVSNSIENEAPDEISPENSIFSQPALTKLSFFDKQIKWLLKQNIHDSFKSQLYQDILSKASDVYKTVKNENRNFSPLSLPPPPLAEFTDSVDLQNELEKNKLEIETLKKELEENKNSPLLKNEDSLKKELDPNEPPAKKKQKKQQNTAPPPDYSPVSARTKSKTLKGKGVYNGFKF